MLDLKRQFSPTKEQRFAALEFAEEEVVKMEREAKRAGKREIIWVIGKFECKKCNKKHFYGGDLFKLQGVKVEKLCPKGSKRCKLVRIHGTNKATAESYNEYHA